jgi:hypothetical protein
MNGGTIEALQALQRRLSHAEAIATCIAEPNDTTFGEAMRGVALMLSDIGDTLDVIVTSAETGAA